MSESAASESAASELVVLFDIDGTLVTTGGAGRRALERTFGEQFGAQNVFANFAFAGMTDPAILREGLRRLGRPFGDLDALYASYVARLREELTLGKAEHRLHRGMEAAVRMLKARPRTAVGLGTGNIVAGAEAKLTPLGAYHWFTFGGFGSDHEDRAELIRIGIQRGLAELRVARARTIIIGDTPKDIDAAKANGALAYAVATGAYDTHALQAAGADQVFSTLEDAGALAAF